MNKKDTDISSDELKMPKFASEREEAEWWDNHPEFILQELERAKAEGRLGHGTVKRRMDAIEAAKAGTTVTVDSGDLKLAAELAERKGIERELFLKELIHSALLKEKESLNSSAA